jgi:hypothetical protein
MQTFQTGDILLYDTRRWYSRLIKFFTNSKYSHVSIILKHPTWLDEKLTEDYYVLESGDEPFEDVVTDRMVFGVRITPFSSVYDQYHNQGMGELYVRKLSTTTPREELCKKIREWYHTISLSPYDTDVMDWIKAYQERSTIVEDEAILTNYQRTDKFWCSALVSYMYVKCGLLDNRIPWTLVIPNDYSETCNILPLINCHLDKEIKI